MGVYIAQGFLSLLDANQRWLRAGHPVSLRIRNFPDIQATSTAAQLGFAMTPSGGAVGTTDLNIDPPPSVTMLTMTAIGRSMGKLRIGARQFIISATFVNAQVAAQGLIATPQYSAQDLVFRGSNVVGLVCDGQLFSIENILHHEYGGVTINWILHGNGLETIQPGVA